MKNLKIDKNAYGLRVNCPKCDRILNQDNIKECTHPERQTYKSVVWTSSGTKVKHHTATRDFDEALMLAIQFKKEVKNGSLSNPLRNQFNIINDGEISVEEALQLFSNFKLGIGVPIYKKVCSEKYAKETIRYVEQFIDVLVKNGLNPKEMPLKCINEAHVVEWYKIMTNHYGRGSWNAPNRALRNWINHMNDKHKVNMYNLFREVPLEKATKKVEAITKDEFEAVCKAVVNENPIECLNGKGYKKNRRKPYLLDAFKMALNTGLRREEYLSLTWDDIIFNNEMNAHMIVTDNLKVERITGEKCDPKYVPVHKELEKLLNDLGWKAYKNTNQRIINPRGTESVQTLMSCCTKGFTHFYKQAFPKVPNKTLNVLRKTYLSYLGKELGENTVVFSSHKGMRVLEKHYFDKKIVTKGYDVKIFG